MCNLIMKCQWQTPKSLNYIQTDSCPCSQIVILLTVLVSLQYHHKCIENMESSTVTPSACSMVAYSIHADTAMCLSLHEYNQTHSEPIHPFNWQLQWRVWMSKSVVRIKAISAKRGPQNSIINHYIWTPAGFIMRVNTSTYYYVIISLWEVRNSLRLEARFLCSMYTPTVYTKAAQYVHCKLILC